MRRHDAQNSPRLRSPASTSTGTGLDATRSAIAVSNEWWRPIAEVIAGLETENAELSAAIEKQNAQIAKKTAELNDGTGLTSRDLVHLQEEIAALHRGTLPAAFGPTVGEFEAPAAVAVADGVGARPVRA